MFALASKIIAPKVLINGAYFRRNYRRHALRIIMGQIKERNAASQMCNFGDRQLHRREFSIRMSGHSFAWCNLLCAQVL